MNDSEFSDALTTGTVLKRMGIPSTHYRTIHMKIVLCGLTKLQAIHVGSINWESDKRHVDCPDCLVKMSELGII